MPVLSGLNKNRLWSIVQTTQHETIARRWRPHSPQTLFWLERNNIETGCYGTVTANTTSRRDAMAQSRLVTWRIPVIFPTFGNVDDGRIMRVGDQRDMLRHMKSVPHHGFAKDCVWDLVTRHEPRDPSNCLDIEDTGGNSCRGSCPSQALLRLSPLNVPVDLGGSWLRESGEWEILYRITLRSDGLMLDLCIGNNNTVGNAFGDLRAKILFHTYFRASSPGNISIHGLPDSHSLPPPGAVSSLHSHVPLRFKVGEFVDQVWRLKPDDAMSVIVEDDENKITAGIGIMTSNLPDLVLWAPEIHAPVEPGVRFICVERGSVVEPFTVPTGGVVFLRQVLTDR